MDNTTSSADRVLARIVDIASTVGQLLVSKPTMTMSIATLTAAIVITVLYFRWSYSRRRRNGVGRRTIPLGRLLQMAFPKRLIYHRTHVFDFCMFVLNHKVIAIVVVWLVVSYHYVSVFVNGTLASVFGNRPASALDPWLVMAIMTIALYLAYEFAYWLDHWLCHTVPFLWEFHRVHHEAEVLSPLTNSRVHPVDSIVFAQVTALVVGGTNGVMTYLLGQQAAALKVFDVNAILVLASFLVVQLQHSHVWIPFTGIWGRIFMSPAHHQIHHSLNPVHYNKNMGSCLAVFDWLFGTLHVPSREREKLTFGVDNEPGVDPHSLEHGLIDPFRRAFRRLRGLVPKGRQDPAPARPIRLQPAE